MAFFDPEYLRNGTTYRHIFEILIGTYTGPTQQCHFEWSCVTMSDLAKYSVTRSVARSLCDSWASCFNRALIAVLTHILFVTFFFNLCCICRSTSSAHCCWTLVYSLVLTTDYSDWLVQVTQLIDSNSDGVFWVLTIVWSKLNNYSFL